MGKVLTNEELKVVDLFRRNLFEEFTIRDIAKKIKKNSYNWVFNAVKNLNSQGILNLKTRGKSSVCSINLENNCVLVYFSLLERLNLPNYLLKKNIKDLLDCVEVDYFSFLITGSYAKVRQNKNSDLDILVIVENKQDAKEILNSLVNKGELMTPKAHAYVFSKEEFLNMLLDKEENYGKLAFRNNKILFGAENYYRIIKEAIKNGFTG